MKARRRPRPGDKSHHHTDPPIHLTSCPPAIRRALRVNLSACPQTPTSIPQPTFPMAASVPDHPEIHGLV